jgi:RNA-directed DNA polymerase
VSTRLTADDATLAANFSNLRSFRSIANLLEIDPRILKHYLRRTNNYKVFSLRKRSGGERVISSPVTALKILQRKLNQVLHAVYRSRSPVHGFVRKKVS